MELLNYIPLKDEKFQFVGRVMEFGLGQAPTGTGYDCINTIFMGLVGDSPQAKPTSLSMELKRPVKSG